MERHTEGVCLGLRVKKAEKQPDRGWGGEKMFQAGKTACAKAGTGSKVKELKKSQCAGHVEEAESNSMLEKEAGAGWQRFVGSAPFVQLAQ